MSLREHREYLARKRNARIFWVFVLVAAAFFTMRWMGVAERERKLNSASLEDLELMAQAQPTDPDVRYRLAFRYTKQFQFAKALPLMEELAARDPRSFEYQFGYANVAAGMGKARLAVEQYLKALALRPNVASAHFAIARIFTEAGLHHNALPHYEKGARLDPKPRADYALWARSLTALGREEEALQRLMACLMVSNRNDDAAQLFVELCIRRKDWRTATQFLEGKINSMRAYPMGLERALLARVLLAQSQDERTVGYADDLCKVALTDEARRAIVYATAARCRLLLGDPKAARALLQMAAATDPAYEEAQELLIEANKALGDQKAARAAEARLAQLTAARREEERIRSSAAAGDHQALGRALQAAGLHGAAAEEFRLALAKKPGTAELEKLLTQSQMEALADLEKRKTEEIARKDAEAEAAFPLISK